MSGEGLRRRNVVVSGGGGEGAAADFSSVALKRLKKIDFYTKVQEDCVQKSQRGGAVTITVAVIMFLLFRNALNEYLTVDIEEKITIDTRLNQKTKVSIDMSFPRLACPELTVETMDSAGNSQTNLRDGLVFTPLSNDGQPLPEGRPGFTGCLPCLEGSGAMRKCCNTCSELLEAYEEQNKPWADVRKTEPRCKNGVGCQVQAEVSVTKMSGNIKVALGGFRLKANDLREDEGDVKETFNTSHVIHSITFGDSVPGLPGALDGTAKFVRQGVYTFNYYLQLVPTIYADLHGNRPLTNQYSVSHKATNIMVRGGELTGLPGVFFVYDFSPFLVVKAAKAQRFTYFITSVCAIIGGAFSIASLVEMLLGKLGRGG